jgi:uncharacterized protein (TIGR01777 family)
LKCSKIGFLLTGTKDRISNTAFVADCIITFKLNALNNCKMEQVLISGGSGLVGRHMTHRLQKSGYQVHILTRGSSGSDKGISYHHWDPANGTLEQGLIENADHVINLAGANLGAKRWNRAYKHLIYQSRVASTRLLASGIQQASNPPKSFVSASAINYYGIQRQELLNECSAPGSHFLSKVCADWEQEANQVDNGFTRVVIPRISTVFAPEEGAFPQMKAPVEWGAGAPLGPGKQRTPWIHIDDLVEMIYCLMSNDQAMGAYNAAAPDSTTNESLMRTIARELHKPFFLPNVPYIMLKLMIGPFAEVLMTDLKLEVSRIQDCGFQFSFGDIQSAVSDLVNR